MKTVKVEFQVRVEDEMTDREIDEWVEFNLGARGGMSNDNPMADEDMSALSFSVRVSS